VAFHAVLKDIERLYQNRPIRSRSPAMLKITASYHDSAVDYFGLQNALVCLIYKFCV